MTITQAIIIAIVYYLANSPLPFGGLGNSAILYRPLVSGLIVGIVLGDPVAGTVIGATINLMYLGFISAGGSKPADMSLAGVMGTALAITGGLDADASLAIAVPLGLLGSGIWVFRMTLNSVFVRIADKYVEKGVPEKVWIANVLLPQAMLFCITAVPGFFIAYFGSNYVINFIGSLSNNVLDVLKTVGGMLPAVGIGMMLLSIFKGKSRIFFFLGFLLSTYLELGTLPLGLIFLCVAILYVGSSKEDNNLSGNITSDSQENMPSQHILTQRDLRKAWWKWMYFYQACYNYERMQGIGFLHAISSALKKIYDNDHSELKNAMRRHAEFYNTENATGSAILGLTLAMEEQRKLGANIEDSAFTSIKTGLMGPVASIGDTVWQAVVIPLLSVVCIGLAKEGNVIAPIIYALTFYLMYYCFGYWMLKIGYAKGSNAILSLADGGALDKVVTGAGILGCAVVGGLVRNYVVLDCAIQIQQTNGIFSLQTDFFDVLVPGVLPLLLTFGCYKLLKKGIATYWVLLTVAVFGALGAVIGIF